MQYKNKTRDDLMKLNKVFSSIQNSGHTNIMLTFQKLTCIPRSLIETEELTKEFSNKSQLTKESGHQDKT